MEPTITQEPLYSIQANVIYTFKRGMWLAVTGGIADGGRPTVSGVEKDKIDNHTRLGGVLVFPFAKRYSIKVSYTNSVRTAIGGDYDLSAFPSSTSGAAVSDPTPILDNKRTPGEP